MGDIGKSLPMSAISAERQRLRIGEAVKDVKSALFNISYTHQVNADPLIRQALVRDAVICFSKAYSIVDKDDVFLSFRLLEKILEAKHEQTLKEIFCYRSRMLSAYNSASEEDDEPQVADGGSSSLDTRFRDNLSALCRLLLEQLTLEINDLDIKKDAQQEIH